MITTGIAHILLLQAIFYHASYGDDRVSPALKTLLRLLGRSEHKSDSCLLLSCKQMPCSELPCLQLLEQSGDIQSQPDPVTVYQVMVQ